MSGIPNVDSLHAGMTQKERDESVGRMKQAKSWIMITTEVMARGMDFKGVREVINYDFPTSVQSYIHRIGMYLPTELLHLTLLHLKAVRVVLVEKARQPHFSLTRTPLFSSRTLSFPQFDY